MCVNVKRLNAAWETDTGKKDDANQQTTEPTASRESSFNSGWSSKFAILAGDITRMTRPLLGVRIVWS